MCWYCCGSSGLTRIMACSCSVNRSQSARLLFLCVFFIFFFLHSVQKDLKVKFVDVQRVPDNRKNCLVKSKSCGLILWGVY